VFDSRYECEVAELQNSGTLVVLGVCDGYYGINVLLRRCEPLDE